MFRFNLATVVSRPVIRCLAEAKVDDYALYLLSDWEQRRQVPSINNAIFLYPDPQHPDMSSAGSRRYVATICKKGKSFSTVSIGERNFSNEMNPPDVNNLIKAVLAKAGIIIPPLLQTIYPVFRELLAPSMDNPSLGSLVRTSLFAKKLTQPELDRRRPMKELKELFGHICEGDATEVKKMLDANPRLSLVRWKAAKEEENVITNKAGQRIYVEGKTGYQFALGEEDIEIARMFKEAILKVADEEEANNQFIAQFPDGWEKDEEKRWGSIFFKLGALTEAIRMVTPGDITSSAYPYPGYKLTVKAGSNVEIKFIDYTASLRAILKEAVTTGRHFNSHLLLAVFETYDKHYADYFGNSWDDPRAMFFLQRAIGRAQLLMPASLVQAFCDPEGLDDVAEKLRSGSAMGRSFEFKLYDSLNNVWVDGDFYPLSFSCLGEHFALGGRGWEHWTPGAPGAGVAAAGSAEKVLKLISIKNSCRLELMPHKDLGDSLLKTKASCSVM